MGNNVVLIDTDAFIGWQIKQDAHHEKSIDIFGKVMARRLKLVVTTLVVAETVNLLSRRYSMMDAKRFLDAIEAFPIIVIDDQLHHDTVQLFRQQTLSKTSFVDIANVAVIRRFNIPFIFSFDRLYGSYFDITYLDAH